MTTRRWKVLALFALAVVLMVVLTAEPALAAATKGGGTNASNIGKNLGDEVTSWGKALLFGVACLVGLPALAKRDLGQSMVVAMITIVLGGFIFAPDTVQNIIDGIWNTLGQ